MTNNVINVHDICTNDVNNIQRTIEEFGSKGG